MVEMGKKKPVGKRSKKQPRPPARKSSLKLLTRAVSDMSTNIRKIISDIDRTGNTVSYVAERLSQQERILQELNKEVRGVGDRSVSEASSAASTCTQCPPAALSRAGSVASCGMKSHQSSERIRASTVKSYHKMMVLDQVRSVKNCERIDQEKVTTRLVPSGKRSVIDQGTTCIKSSVSQTGYFHNCDDEESPSIHWEPSFIDIDTSIKELESSDSNRDFDFSSNGVSSIGNWVSSSIHLDSNNGKIISGGLSQETPFLNADIPMVNQWKFVVCAESVDIDFEQELSTTDKGIQSFYGSNGGKGSRTSVLKQVTDILDQTPEVFDQKHEVVDQVTSCLYKSSYNDKKHSAYNQINTLRDDSPALMSEKATERKETLLIHSCSPIFLGPSAHKCFPCSRPESCPSARSHRMFNSETGSKMQSKSIVSSSCFSPGILPFANTGSTIPTKGTDHQLSVPPIFSFPPDSMVEEDEYVSLIPINTRTPEVFSRNAECVRGFNQASIITCSSTSGTLVAIESETIPETDSSYPKKCSFHVINMIEDSGESSSSSSRTSISELCLPPRPDTSCSVALPTRLAGGDPDVLRESLLLAIESGKSKAVEEVLDCGVDVNFVDERGRTPLHRAVAKANPGIVSLLIKHNAKVEAKDSYGRTPLHIAALRDHFGLCVTLLMDAGAEISCATHSGRTPLHYAADCANEVAVRALMAAGASSRARDDRGRTPLDHAKTMCVNRLLRTPAARSKALRRPKQKRDASPSFGHELMAKYAPVGGDRTSGRKRNKQNGVR